MQVMEEDDHKPGGQDRMNPMDAHRVHGGQTPDPKGSASPASNGDPQGGSR